MSNVGTYMHNVGASWLVGERKMLITTQLVMLSCAALLGALTLTHNVNVGWLLGLTFVISIGGTFNMPPWSSITPEVVPRDASSAPMSDSTAGIGMIVAGLALAPVIHVSHMDREDVHMDREDVTPMLTMLDLAACEPAPADGPVLVAIEWTVDPARVDEFAESMRPVHRLRRRTGASAVDAHRRGSGRHASGGPAP